MTLDEAIIHARQVAEGCSSENKDCAYQHDKLADWLEELRRYKNAAPAVDAVEVVRCGECRRAVVSQSSFTGEVFVSCSMWPCNPPVCVDEFCARGERKDK